jgi:hypothetical protein
MTLDSLIATILLDGWHISLHTKHDGSWEASCHKPSPAGLVSASGAFFAYGKDTAESPVDALTIAHVKACLDLANLRPMPFPEPLPDLLNLLRPSNSSPHVPRMTRRI